MTLNKTRLAGLLVALCATLGMAGAAAAQGGEEGRGFGLGLMGFSGKTPYGNRQTAALPVLDFDSRYVRFSGPEVDLKLPWISSGNLEFSLRANLAVGEGYEAKDAPILGGMAKRDAGFWAGAAMQWRTDLVDLSFEALADVGGDSKGRRFRAEASRSFFLSERVMIQPRLAAVWMNGNMVDYYYGVRAGEATATRAAYSGSSAVNLEAGLSLGYMLTQRQMIMLDLGATRLGKNVTNSPIVRNRTLTSVGLGYMIRF